MPQCDLPKANNQGGLIVAMTLKDTMINGS